MKIKFIKDKAPLKEVVTDMMSLAVTPFGVRFLDPEINTQRMMAFDKFDSFTVECDVTEKHKENSRNLQKIHSDSNSNRRK